MRWLSKSHFPLYINVSAKTSFERTPPVILHKFVWNQFPQNKLFVSKISLKVNATDLVDIGEVPYMEQWNSLSFIWFWHWNKR